MNTVTQNDSLRKSATYTIYLPVSESLEVALRDAPDRFQLDGTRLTVRYDPDAPCRGCGKPVIEASMSGTDVCPWCDTGTVRQ